MGDRPYEQAMRAEAHRLLRSRSLDSQKRGPWGGLAFGWAIFADICRSLTGSIFSPEGARRRGLFDLAKITLLNN